MVVAPDPVPVGLRTLGRARVLQALIALIGQGEEPSLSRPELMRITGLARATVASVADDLIRAGLIEEDATGPVDGRIGRPPRAVRLAPSAAYAFGIDVGH